MAVVDLEEYRRLQNAISAMERVLAASPHGASSMFATGIQNAKRELEKLEYEIKQEQEKIQAERAAAVAEAIQQEATLTESERGIFADFLKKEYFTKQDMPRVDSFYKQTWDKLTEGGKDAISHRVWEGIRHGEAKFSELLENIKEKEAERVHKQLTDSTIGVNTLAQIPETDRKDFIGAYEGGKKEEAYQILNRQSFTNNVSLNATHVIKSQNVQDGREADSKAIVAAAIASTPEKINQKDSANPPSMAELDLDSINLKDMKIADGTTQANLPRSDKPASRSL